MRCAVVRPSTDKHGRVREIGSVELRDLTATAAENLSEIATVVSLEGVGIGGMTTVYEDRTARQALMTPEMRELLETLALETSRRTAQRVERGGWIS